MKSVYCAIILCLLMPVILLPNDKIILGLEDQWYNIEYFESITSVSGKGGKPAITLQAGRHQFLVSTDMMVRFAPSPTVEKGNNYTIVEKNLKEAPSMGRKNSSGALISTRNPGLILKPEKSSLFTPGSMWTDFTIDFWLKSLSLREGETIFLWKGLRETNSDIIPQTMRLSIENRTLTWRFENLFLPPDHSTFTLTLSGTNFLIPREWSHHSLRFNSSLGLVEYFVNGVSEDIIHATPSGREESKIYFPYIGSLKVGEIIIGQNFSGFIEDFRILKKQLFEIPPVCYPQNKGVLITEPLYLGRPESSLDSIHIDYSAPADSSAFFYYRMNTNEWKPFIPAENIYSQNKGSTIQLKIELYPDGTRSYAPTIESITINYRKNKAPRAPTGIYTEPFDSGVKVSWQQVSEPDIEGYLLFYGTQPGNYFGKGADLGDSPIDAGEQTSIDLSGLANGTIYYFAVSAYDKAGPDYIEHFSKETSARPGSHHE